MAEADRQARLITRAQAAGLLPPDALQQWRAEGEGPSWVLTVLSFLGAQLVVLPFLGFLLVVMGRLVFEPPGAFVGAALLLGGATLVLRLRPGHFVAHMAFSALLAGLALLMMGWDWRLNSVAMLSLLAVSLGLGLAVPQDWVRRVLGFVAACAFMALRPSSGLEGHEPDVLEHALGLMQTWLLAVNTAVLAVVWALWLHCSERGLGPAWMRRHGAALHALADGVGVALLLAAAYVGAWQLWGLALWSGLPMGSADAAGAGLARIFRLGAWQLLQMLLVLGAGIWLWRHWELRQRQPLTTQALLVLVCGLLLLACLVLPRVGVVALVGTLALGSGRRALAALAAVVLLGLLAGFYYALAWPLAHKAALLAGTGAALALALVAVHMLSPRAAASEPAPAASAPDAGPRWLAPALVAGGALLALGLVQLDVTGKERVITQGQRIYVELAPRDPRSLMQGDYMALNLALPDTVRQALRDHPPPAVWEPGLQVLASLDERGVASVQRLLGADEAVAPGQVRLPLRWLKGQWVLVSDAYFFPEGQGRPFARARYGEFRVLPGGRALLVGLADEHLQAIQPAPDDRGHAR